MARDARKAGDLSYEDILHMGCARYLGQGRYRDLSGLSLALSAATIDRLDPKGGYSLAKVRLLHSALNFIRNDAPDDGPIRQVIAHLRAADLCEVDTSVGMLGDEHFGHWVGRHATGEELEWGPDIYELDTDSEDADAELDAALEADELEGDQEVEE
jgi:hypothetical protein